MLPVIYHSGQGARLPHGGGSLSSCKHAISIMSRRWRKRAADLGVFRPTIDAGARTTVEMSFDNFRTQVSR